MPPKEFLSDDFLLESETARRLYREHAARMRIIDYHTHLSPALIATDHRFETITEAWLDGDHYKWRAMRANGVDERFCTGDAGPWEKFSKWAETVPYAMMNPLYHWSHLELRRTFGITDLLAHRTARPTYERCNELLASPDLSARGLLKKANVDVVCTTDDPADSLDHHIAIRDDPTFDVAVLPAFRADTASRIEVPAVYNRYLDRLAETADVDIANPSSLLEALRKRHDAFDELGCRTSDHGESVPYAMDFTAGDVAEVFDKVRRGEVPERSEVGLFKSWLLHELALMDHESGWAQQFHLGPLRNTRSRMLAELGRDTGFDSIGDFEMARPLAAFLDRLDRERRLAKTILYNSNPRDNNLFATMAANFNEGPVPGKVQFGAAWWHLDQKDGIERQLTTVASTGLLSRFIGMLTDSRSFLSYPRHEYFRRILCNVVGGQVERGELPFDEQWLGQIVEDVCYNNVKSYLRL